MKPFLLHLVLRADPAPCTVQPRHDCFLIAPYCTAMTHSDIATHDGQTTVLDEATLTGFRNRLHGTLLQPDDGDYDAARRVWNGMIDRRPALIAQCANADDAIEAVNFARTHGLRVAVRGGGHNVAGTALCDDGLVIDLSRMNDVRVHPTARRVHAEGGATIGDLDRATQPHGLAAPMGVVTETGIAGLTLGGGLGWLRRKHGLSCDALRSVDVITADGQLDPSKRNRAFGSLLGRAGRRW